MNPLEFPPVSHRLRLDALEAAIRTRTALVPRAGIVLGSGLGRLADELEGAVAIPFQELPGWPAASAPGHAGRLLLGRLAGQPVALLQGRLHLYEGYPPGLVVEPVLLMGRLGAGVIVLTNAAGGLHPAWGVGTLMIVASDLNLTGRNPLIGPNDADAGPRFPDMLDAWDPELRALLRRAGALEGVPLVEGVYAGLLGPSYETLAEVRMLQRLGAHAVGMSTVLEAIAVRWAGLRLCGVSLITNQKTGPMVQPLSHEQVLAAAEEAGTRLARVLRRFVTLLPAD